MKNEKGFTLMELLAALFIGGMVTAALILVWKTAATQTSQGQRQTIIRNKVSNFQRQFYKDFYDADIIVTPPENSSDNTISSTGIILSGVKKAKRINAYQFEPFHQNSSEGPTKAFVYCYNNNTNAHRISRYEQIINYSADNPIKDIYAGGNEAAPFTDSFLNTCISSGRVVLTDFTLTGFSRTSNGQYSLQGRVQKTFADRAETTPIVVNINESLLESGGI